MESISKFSTSDEYKLTSNFPNAASIVEDESVRYLIKGANFVAGDIVLWNGVQKVVVAQENYSTTVFPEEKFTPIGVVVAPETHMPDGRARMMSLRWMSCGDPENGSTEPQQMYWGTGVDIEGIDYFTEVPIIARYDDEGQGGVVPLTVPQIIYTTNEYGFLSSDMINNEGWTGETNPEDPGTKWKQSSTYWVPDGTGAQDVWFNNFYLPSPYAVDGTPNPLYRATTYSGGTINNLLSYFDGRHQTNMILLQRGERDYTSWKPITNENDDYPAASVCDMYHTVGTSQGDWYLPSAAEYGYLMVRVAIVANALAKINGIHFGYPTDVWTSTRYDKGYPCRANSWFIMVKRNAHTQYTEGSSVIAFCKV